MKVFYHNVDRRDRGFLHPQVGDFLLVRSGWNVDFNFVFHACVEKFDATRFDAISFKHLRSWTGYAPLQVIPTLSFIIQGNLHISFGDHLNVGKIREIEKDFLARGAKKDYTWV